MIKHVDSGGQVKLVTNVRRPRKWRRYEYLLSSGELYIDTGIYGYMNHTYEITYQLISTATNCTQVWGTRGKDTYTGLNMSVTYAGNAHVLYWVSATNGTNYVSLGTINTNKHILLIENGHVHFDGVDKGTSTGHDSSFSIQNNIYLFGYNSNGTPYSTSSKIYEYKDYDVSGNLLLHLVPALYNGEYGMWDLVEDKFYKNAGTGLFTVGPEIKNYDEIDEVRRTSSILPAGIELYDYILSSGTLYIDTGYVPNNTSGIYLRAYCTTSGGNHLVIGCRQTSGDTRWWINYSTYLELSWNLYTLTLTGYTNTWTEIEHNYMNSRSAKVNGTAYSVSYPTLTNITYSAYLFNSCSQGNPGSGFIGRISNAKITEGTTTVRNFLPCTYLGEPGMWDTVENKFYRNQGTGQFILGNKITLKEHEYLLNTGTLYIDTEVIALASTKIETKLEVVGNSHLFGARPDSFDNTGALMYSFYSTLSEIRHDWLGIATTYTSISGPFVIKAYKKTIELNGEVSTREITKLDLNIDITLGKANGYDGSANNGLAKYYYFKIWYDNTLIRDFIPCSYNGTPGLWDKVEWKFYGNSGSGSFTVGKEIGGLYFKNKAPKAYGIEWTINLSATTCTRIGDWEYHKTLPILSQFRGCVYDTDNKLFKYWLKTDNWAYKEDGTASVLDGTDGQVMVHTPRFWGASGERNGKYWVMISPTYVEGWLEIPEMYIGAYRCTVANNKAVSVVNTTATYRGGGNRRAYDTYLSTDPYRSDLGKPRTNISRVNFRTYARNASTELLCYEYYKWIFYWCYVIEYADFHCQKAYNANLDSNGFRQGGLGPGVTTWNSTNWNTYRGGYYAITPCGYCNDIGNGTGIKNLIIPTTVINETNIPTITFAVPRWRGFDNPFGDIWTNLDGIIILGDTEGNPKNVYTTTDPTKFGDTETFKNNMSIACNEVHTDVYVKEFDLGTLGNILPVTVGGGATTYKADYHYTGSKDTTLRTLRLGGGASNGGGAGLGCLYSDYGVGDAGALIGFRAVVVVV